jgi:hypothetical protein
MADSFQPAAAGMLVCAAQPEEVVCLLACSAVGLLQVWVSVSRDLREVVVAFRGTEQVSEWASCTSHNNSLSCHQLDPAQQRFAGAVQWRQRASCPLVQGL